ncbi:MAG: hypothetical protein ACI9K4_001585, partial [Polaribacter sp.]
NHLVILQMKLIQVLALLDKIYTCYKQKSCLFKIDSFFVS